MHHLFGAVVFRVAESKAEFQGGHLLPSGRFAGVANYRRAFACRIDFSQDLFSAEAELSVYRRHRTPACTIAVVACSTNLHGLILFRAVAYAAQVSGNGLVPARSRTDVINTFAGLG